MSRRFEWDDDKAMRFCEYVALRVNTQHDFKEQMKYLVEDFKASLSKEIKDTEQSSRPFVWDDALIDEYALRMEKESLTVERFKELKQNSKSIPAGKGTALNVQNTQQ